MDGLYKSGADQWIIDLCEEIQSGLVDGFSVKIDPLNDNPEEILLKILKINSIQQ